MYHNLLAFYRVHCHQGPVWAGVLLYQKSRWPHPEWLEGHGPKKGWHRSCGEHRPVPRVLAGVERWPQHGDGSRPAKDPISFSVSTLCIDDGDTLPNSTFDGAWLPNFKFFLQAFQYNYIHVALYTIIPVFSFICMYHPERMVDRKPVRNDAHWKGLCAWKSFEVQALMM